MGTAALILGGVALLAALLVWLQPAGVSSTCTSCTTTITGLSTATINPSSGAVICITSTGDFRGIIRRNSSSGSGTVIICNEGTIQGATLEFNKGTNVIHNYGTLSPSSFQFNSGTSSNTITNYAGATASFPTFALYKSGTVFENHGSFTSGSFMLSSGASFVNHAGGDVTTERVEVNSNSELTSEGTWYANGSFQVNSNGEATILGSLDVTGAMDNNGELEINGVVNIGGNLNMNGSSDTELDGTITVGGNVEANKSLDQAGTLQISGNFNVNGSAQLEVAGLISVGNNLNVNGRIEGPETSSGNWGRINVAGVSTLNGGGRLSENLDVCDAGTPSAGLDYQYGTKATSVTHCLNAPAGSLPVEWGNVEALPTAAGIQISWVTHKELNNDYFTVERSLDARTFETVTDLPGAGTTDVAHTYEVTDPHPPGTRVYYRVRQTDYDGQHAWSPIVESSWIAPAFGVSFFPNPVSDQGQLRISADKTTSATVRVLTLAGQLISTQEVALLAGENTVDYQTDTWAPGVYLVEVRRQGAGAVPVSLKIIKQ
ncbi:MAG: T9SS type A sorting domain-containing protein [Bacteroidia bacterium]|nr:T9SS type A sorting domain-containing protein [Bacteroidia bacterium]